MMLLGLAAAGCSFNFELTSQRTALENQVMGSYKELEDDLLLISAVRGTKTTPTNVSPHKQPALDAKQNQDFNQDDIDELKSLQILGETNNGMMTTLPGSVGAAKEASSANIKLANQLVGEENRDREVIWKRIIDSNENLSAKDLPAVRKTYAKMQRESASPGQWFQDESGSWVKKASDKM